MTTQNQTNGVGLSRNSSAAHFNFNINGASLEIFCNSPSAQVIDDFWLGDAKFAFFESEGVLFFLSNFGRNGWMDAPFHAALNRPDATGVPAEFVPGQHHFGLAVNIRDARTWAVYRSRLVTISKEMSKRLVEIAQIQWAEPFSRKQHDRRIEAAYAKFTASGMARRASLRCRGGENEPCDIGSVASEPSTCVSVSGDVVEFTHVTLNTGHRCLQHASSVCDASNSVVKRLIRESSKTGWADLELEAVKYPVHIVIDGSNLTCRLCLQLENGPVSVVVIGVALDPVAGKELWRAIHASTSLPLATRPDLPPHKPWIAAFLTADELQRSKTPRQSFQLLEMLGWAGDFERCLAFGFAELSARQE